MVYGNYIITTGLRNIKQQRIARENINVGFILDEQQ